MTAAAGAGPAAAQEPLPENNAGADQYVEPVPDAGGDRAAPNEGDRPRSRPLPRETREALPPGEEGRILESIGGGDGGGRSDEGASRDGSGSGRGGQGSGRDAGAEGIPRPANVQVDSNDSGARRLVALVAGLILAIVTAGAVIRRRRRS